MKTLLAFFFAFCFAMGGVFSQERVDVVRLKDGKVYRGEITRKIPGEPVELRVGRNNVYVFQEDEIASIATETIGVLPDSLDRFGVGPGLGFAVGGGGILGVPFRVPMGKHSSWEIGPYIRPFIIKYYNGGSEINLHILLATAISFNMKKKFNPQLGRVVSHGLFIRGGTSFGDYKESIIGFGWTGERFKSRNPKLSFIHELGPGIVIRHWYSEEGNFGENTKKVGFILAWKLHINGYLK